eukprot:3653501-Prymnesium_polylepis.1
MITNKDELRLTLSAVKALSGMASVPPVPEPFGGTNLIGAVKRIVESGTLGQQQIVIITDGLDNQHDVTEFQTGTTDAGEPVMTTVAQGDFATDAEYMSARQRAILDYLE